MKGRAMLYLTECIGGSAVRKCYVHPLDKNLCVKIVQKMEDLSELMREVNVAELLTPYLKDYIVRYDNELVETDKGQGLVCGLVRNEDDGELAMSLAQYQECFGAKDVEPELRKILECLIRNNLFFYDFNRSNFVVQRLKSGRKKVVFIDLKGFHKNHYMGFLKMERFIAPLARNIMFRRMRTLYLELNIDVFPLDALCHEKMFSSFWVDVKL